MQEPPKKNKNKNKQQENSITLSPLLIYLSSVPNSQLGNLQFRHTWNNQSLTTMVLPRETIEFKTCDGTILRGWFYPQDRKSPCVIMTHGVRTL
jgi:hypothetical protein